MPHLSRAKLSVPRVDATRHVARSRVVDRLEEMATRHAVVVVVAPAGFGKTSALAEWATGRDHQGGVVAWLSLDAADADPARFLRYFVGALASVGPSMNDVIAMLAASPRQPVEAVFDALNEALAGAGRNVTLVVDDFHLLGDPEIHDALGLMASRSPPGFRLVIASRTEPPLGLARLRARGVLGELRTAELAFDAPEAALLLSAVTGQAVGADSATAAVARTEGWAAGLQLAAIASKQRGDLAAVLREINGEHRDVFDFVSTEVFDSQPEEVGSFLMETSLFDRLSPSLCDAVTKRTDAEELLKALERAGLFLASLDERRSSYRYHDLFREFLLARLHALRPEAEVAELHRRAAAWYERAKQSVAAIRHALAAADYRHAADLLFVSGTELSFGGEGSVLLKELDAVPEGVIRSTPELALAHAAMSMVTGISGRVVEDRLRITEKAALEMRPASESRASEAARNAILGRVAGLRATMTSYAGRWSRCVEHSQRALELLPGDDGIHGGLVLANLAAAHLHHGEVDPAVQALALLNQLSVRSRVPAFVRMYAACKLGRAHFMAGRLGASEAAWRSVLEIASHAPAATLVVCDAELGLARVAYERDRLEEATERAAAIRRTASWSDAEVAVEALLLQARLARARGDEREVDRALGAAREAATRSRLDWLGSAVEALGVRVALFRGDRRIVEDWAERCPRELADAQGNVRDAELAALVRTLIASGRPEEALQIAARLREAAGSGGRGATALVATLLEALCLDASRQQDESLRCLEGALRIAAQEGYVRFVVDEGDAAERLFARFVKERRDSRSLGRTIPEPFLAGIRVALDRTPGRRVSEAPPPLAEAVSPRELEVIELIAEGISNDQIARRLHVATSTVKRHVHNVFRKLDVRSRTEAVARARSVGILR